MRLSIKQCQTHTVCHLCQLQSRHASLVRWPADLLWSTITYMLSQCAGDFRSHFVADVVPLVELATTVNVYPPLTITNSPRRGIVRLWDFMTQAEVYTLLCVYLRSVHCQLGPSQLSLDFKIVGTRRPSDMDPPLPVNSAGSESFVDVVENAIVDNLRLLETNLRRTGQCEWWVIIEDLPRVIQALPNCTDVPLRNYSVTRTPALPVGLDVPESAGIAGRRSTATDSRGSSSHRVSTPSRKVLLATPPAVTSAPAVTSHTTAFSSLPTSGPARPARPQGSPRSRYEAPAVPCLRAIVQSPAISVPSSVGIRHALPPPGAPYHSVPRMDHQRPVVPWSGHPTLWSEPPPLWSRSPLSATPPVSWSRPTPLGPCPSTPWSRPLPSLSGPRPPMPWSGGTTDAAAVFQAASGPAVPTALPGNVSGLRPRLPQAGVGSSSMLPCTSVPLVSPLISLSVPPPPVHNVMSQDQFPPPVARARMAASGTQSSCVVSVL